MTPRATVRLQLDATFGFDAACACVDYYAALGISHFYLSPVFRARAGSTHGYDTVDFARISDELGGDAALLRLARALRERDMGIILDIVPNHMGVAGGDNAWWNDVLAHGRASRYAGHFDIDWDVPDEDLAGRLLLPCLDRPRASVLAEGRIRVVAGALACGDARWPLSAPSRTPAPGPGEEGRENLPALLARQHYVLDDWRSAATRINWRRFFDVAELAALRVEQPQVFDDVHRRVLDLYASGIIDGVRIDHVDGLAFPLEYCRKLRDELETRRKERPAGLRDADPYVVVEKVFAAHEPQRDWGVAGTTGYDFMDQVAAVLHNPAGQGPLDVLWRELSGRPWEWRAAVTDARRQVLAEAFAADLERVARAFIAIAAATPDAPDLSPDSLRRALRELVVAFPVYRCYGMPGELPPEDAAILATALERATRDLDPEDYAALDFLGRCLREPAPAASAQATIEAAVRFQQLTTPVAAKAIEDTAFYREARLLSRNEVGSDPNVFSIGVDEFHAACAMRARRFPDGLLATATHDHKRGEDVRARLAVLTDAAPAWSAAVGRWFAMNAALRPAVAAAAPDPVDEYMLYQALVGALPLDPLDDDASRDRFWQRIARWWVKAMREAKRNTSWVAPNAAYEDACMRYLTAIVDGSLHEFEDDLREVVESIAPAGAAHGLVQAFLRLTTPGVPDLYQGCELWDFSLVDPDNRSPVDYPRRRDALASGQAPGAALGHWRDGAVKQSLIACLLRHRARNAALYARGDYRPLLACGSHAANVIAFERRHGDLRLIAIASRWPLSMAGAPLREPRVDPSAWGDTWVAIEQPGEYHDVLRDSPASIESELRLQSALRDFPCALLATCR